MSSWKELNNGSYGTVYDMDNVITTVCGNWELSFGRYIDEDGFWFDEDDDGGIGGTDIGAMAYLSNRDTGATIRFAFSIYYNIFGEKDNPDEFYLSEPDRSLDYEAGVGYTIDEVIDIDEQDAKEFIDDNIKEIFDAIVPIVNDQLYKFGYEL